MPFAIIPNDPNFSLLSGTIPLATFITARDDYQYRIRNNTCSLVNLCKDSSFITFPVETIKTILRDDKKLIVARFGCQNHAAKYSSLTVSLCSMNPGEVDNSTTLYKDGLIANQKYQTQVWRENEANYKLRTIKLLQHDPAEYKEEKSHGIAHTKEDFDTKWFQPSLKLGMTHVAVHFIKLPNYITLAYMDARFDPHLIILEEIYDQGTGCCPV